MLIPENLKIEAVIAIGHPDEFLKPIKKESLKHTKIHENKYKK